MRLPARSVPGAPLISTGPELKSGAAWLASATPEEVDEFLGGLSENALLALPWLFEFWALPHQLDSPGQLRIFFEFLPGYWHSPGFIDNALPLHAALQGFLTLQEILGVVITVIFQRQGMILAQLALSRSGSEAEVQELVHDIVREDVLLVEVAGLGGAVGIEDDALGLGRKRSSPPGRACPCL